jgi:hypothetical protein
VKANEWILLINTIATVPLAQMLITNVLKKAKVPGNPPPAGAALNYSKKTGFYAAVPVPNPVLGQVNGVARSGLLFPVFSGVL